MPEFIQKWISAEVLKHPAVFLAGIVCMGIIIGSFNPFVMADDFSKFQVNANQRLVKLERAVCTVQYTTEKNALEAQSRAVATEIFQLERLDRAGEATERDISRMNNLRTDASNLDLRLRTLVQTTDCDDESLVEQGSK